MNTLIKYYNEYQEELNTIKDEEESAEGGDDTTSELEDLEAEA